MSNEKWEMFKNYMHNELGITKDDIRAWIKEAAKEQVERLVNQEFGKFDVERHIKSVINNEFFYYKGNLKGEIAKIIADKIELTIKE